MTIWIKIAEGDQTSWMARLISCVHLSFLSDQVSWLLPGAKWAPGSDLNPSWKGKYTGTQRKKIRAKITSWLQTWDITSITGFNTWYHIFCQFLPVCIIIFFKRYSQKGLFVNQFSCSVMSDSLQSHVLQHTNFPVHHQLPEFTQTHVHWVDDAIQPSHSLSSPSPPAFNLSSVRVFPVSQFFTSGGQSIGASASASVLPMNIQDWFPLGWTDWIFLQVQGTLKSLLQYHSSKASILWHSAFFLFQLSHPYMTTGKTIALPRRTFVSKVMSLLFNMLSRLIIAFLPRIKCLLISWLQSPSAVILDPKKIKSVTVSIVSPSISHEVMGPDAMILVFWMLSFKLTFSLSFSLSSRGSLRKWRWAFFLLLYIWKESGPVLKVKVTQFCMTLCHPMDIQSMSFSRPE